MLAEIAALTTETQALRADKQSLREKQECAAATLGKYAKDVETAKSCRFALLRALEQSQQEAAATKDELRRHRAESRAIECVVCSEETADVAFGPCGHLCVCTKCSKLVQECLICRG